MLYKFITGLDKAEVLRIHGLTAQETDELKSLVGLIGKELNIKFSFTFLKKSLSDYNILDHSLFAYICPEPYRNIEISNYVLVKKTPIIQEPFTVHFRSVFDANGDYIRDIFPSGAGYAEENNSFIDDPMQIYIRNLDSSFYDFFQSRQKLINNISFHYGLSGNHVIPSEIDGHATIAPNGRQYSKDETLSKIISTLNSFKYNLDNLGIVNYSLLGENLDYNQDKIKHPDGSTNINSAYEYTCEPQVINTISRQTGTNLLFDIGHAIITIKNLWGQQPTFSDMESYINELCKTEQTLQPDYSRIKEVHFVVPSYVQLKNEELSAQTGRLIISEHLQDRHYSFVSPVSEATELNTPVTRKQEYQLAIDSLKFIINQHQKNRANSEPLIINIETDSANRNLYQELKMIAEELSGMLQEQNYTLFPD